MKANSLQQKLMNEKDAALQIEKAATAKKCWGCGCLHSSLKAIEDEFSTNKQPADLETAITSAQERLIKVEYDCLGCKVCFPAIAINILGVEGDACSTEGLKERKGWPPFPGSYTVLRYQAPVAICTLTNEELSKEIALAARTEVAIVGTLQTENLGIERLILNLLANPYIRFLLICGADSQQTIGHLPGQSLVSLASFGIDSHSRIIGARGKRPIVKNISKGALEHFIRTVEVLDLIGDTQVPKIFEVVQSCAQRNPGPAEPFAIERMVTTSKGYLPKKMVPDPAGYFVVYVDQSRRLLSLEHYRNNGMLDTVIEGKSAAELYTPSIERNLVSRLDHAAYLGRELARAEQALQTGELYVQDAAPESIEPSIVSTCGCDASCGEVSL